MQRFWFSFWAASGVGWGVKAHNAAMIFIERGDWPQAIYSLAIFAISMLCFAAAYNRLSKL